MPEEQSTRDRVRALVREVLEKAAPAEEPEGGVAAPTVGSVAPPTAAGESSTQSGEQPRARVVNVAADAAARAVAEGSADLGIVIDGAGVGSAMTANKVPGVRAAACYDAKVARNSREHNDANVLTLGSGTIDSKQMREIVRVWLSTEISEERHKRRVAKIEAVERQYRS